MEKLKTAIVAFKKNGISYVRDNTSVAIQFLVTFFFIGIGIWFFKHEEVELHQVKSTLATSHLGWLMAGVALTFVYIVAQGLMYVSSFASVGNKVTVTDAIILFLKRNFISVFLPAGGISSLAFFTGAIEKKSVNKTQIHLASSIYAFVGILSVVVVAIPAFIFAFIKGTSGAADWFALVTLLAMLLLIYQLFDSITSGGMMYQKLIRYFPKLEAHLAVITTNTIKRNQFIITLLYSTLIEIIGVAHVYIAMMALHLEPSLFAALMSYITATLFLIVSPFLRGLGAIEVSMSYVLIRNGYNESDAISVTILYRCLEFWLPLLAGMLSFLFKLNKLLIRIFPALLLLVLGIVNIISALTPAISERLHFLKDFIPVGFINASNYFVFIAGLFLLVTSAFMLKGLKMAWNFAVGLCLLSIAGNLIKAGDYEEALFALFVLIILYISRKEYYIQNSRRLGLIGLQTTLFSCLTVLIYGCVGFYYLDQKHFHIDFGWKESIRYTLQNFVLVGSPDLVPQDAFAHNFLYSINISGFLCMTFLVYALVRPFIQRGTIEADDLQWAKEQVVRFGNSAMDYFKTYSDKLIFRAQNGESFVAYRVTGSFAVVLECPVGPLESLKSCIAEFEKYCYQHGLKSIYYRVSEKDLALFQGKKSLFLGQEAIVDLTKFSLEGGSKKSIRNGIRKVADSGYTAKLYIAPIENTLLEKLKQVSDEWLITNERKEIIFSQGMFSSEELKEQTMLTVEDANGNVVAFLNIIPDYAPGEATFDLIRKTRNAPGGVMDFITVELFQYLAKQGYTSVNLGFAPLSGIDTPQNFPERSMKFAYEKIRAFSHYKGLRDFKEKFSPTWHNKYLIYDQDYDLFKVPRVLTEVIKS